MGKNVKCLTKAGYHCAGFHWKLSTPSIFGTAPLFSTELVGGFKLTILIFLIIRMA